MSRFTKFASAAVLVTSLAPFAAQARHGDYANSLAPAHTNAAQVSRNQAGHGFANVKFAANDVPVASRHVGGASSDSYGG